MDRPEAVPRLKRLLKVVSIVDALTGSQIAADHPPRPKDQRVLLATIRGNVQDRLTNLKSWLGQNMRRVKLPELLIEDIWELPDWLHFRRNSSLVKPLAVAHLKQGRSVAQ